MRRHLPPSVAALTALAVVPALVALPTLSLPAAKPHPVSGSMSSFAVSGVDAASWRREEPSPATIRAVGGSGVVAAAMSRRPAALTAQRSTKRFDLVALTWDGALPDGATLQVKVREQGTWSSWQDVAPEADGPDAGTAEARASNAHHATAPLLADGGDGVQVRIDSATGAVPANLRAQLVDGGRSGADAPTNPPGSAAADTGQPTLVTRAQWGADESLVKASPTINPTVQALFLHHTDTVNSYSAAEAYAQVRSIYVFHTKVRGWNDIGYNFLVDRFGKVYEGRRGSITDAVQGAHTGGFNENSLGIAALGTFSTVGPTSAMLAGIESVMAWKAAQYGIDPRGSTVLTSAGSSYTKYPLGAKVTFRTISGHRDAGLTECPGNDLYPLLPAIRASVTARMAPGLFSPTTSTDTPGYGAGPIGFTAGLPTVQRWWLMATSMCGNEPLRTLSGRTSGRITTSWDLKDDAGNAVPPGVYQLTMITSSPVGAAPTWTRDVEVLPALAAPASTCRVSRLATTDLATSAVLAGQAAYPTATGVVLVASGAVLDGLVAAPLAHVKAAPLLVTAPATLPPVVAADITARHATTAWIVGGGVSTAVDAQLKALGVTTVVRLAGTDRYSTAAAVAREVGAPAGSAVVVSGENGKVADVVAAAGPAAALNRPLLLVTAASVPAATASALKALAVKQATVVGGTPQVSLATSARLATLGVTGRTRVTSTDRYGLAAAVDGALLGGRPAGRVVVVPAADAAAAWAMLGTAQGLPTLLTDPTAVPAVTASWLVAHKAGTTVSVTSDPAHATPTVLRNLVRALG